MLAVLAKRWQFEFDSDPARERVGCLWCRMADGRRAVLKASPDRTQLAFELLRLAPGILRTPLR